MDLEKLEYQRLKAPNEEIRTLLSQTIYGTKEGGMRIRHCDTEWKLDELIAPDYHVLYDEGKLVGVVVYSNRRAMLGGEKLNTYYIRYFSIAPAYQNKGVAQFLTKVAVQHYRSTLQEPTVVYAFIEAKNFRSQAVSEHFEPLSLGCFSPIYFSRFFPKRCNGVSLNKEDFYRYYNWNERVNFRYIGRSDNNAKYYTLERGGHFAAVRCYTVEWEVLDYPNNNWLMKRLLPNIPLIKKLVEGTVLNFVAVDGVAWDSDDLLLELLENILADVRLAKLFLFADLNDKRYESLRVNKQLGTMSNLQKPPKIGVQLFFHECSDELKKSIQSMPVEVRGFDVT